MWHALGEIHSQEAEDIEENWIARKGRKRKNK